MFVTKRDGSTQPRDINKIHKLTEWATQGLDVSQSELEMNANLLFFDGMKTSMIHDSITQAAAGLNNIEAQDWTFVAARLVLLKLYKEAWNDIDYPHLRTYLVAGVANSKLDTRLVNLFDLNRLNDAIAPERDRQFTYIGIQTLADRYLIRDQQKRTIELPQHFFMRVAMGLSVLEEKPTERAIEFYNVLSHHEFINSTPTLFNSGTLHAQLASCFLNSVADTITNDEGTHRFASIYGTIEECAILSKYAGGLGTDWHRLRGMGGYIKGTDGTSSGIVPYLKVFNDTAVAVNQGGKRAGSFAAYIEPHHPDAFAFIDLKKESGDDRQRAHDIFPAFWMNDLFMQRKEEKGVWSFFCPHTYPELHELYGEAFEARYTELETAGKYVEQVSAMDMWKKILGALFETGHPWITFKDECNRRNPQQHVGVVHSSNLCTEITLNTSDDETAVCNIGSVNMAVMKSTEHMKRVIRTAMRMLDNVIDINFYGSDRAKASNLRHRPVGLGMMGYTEWLVKNGIDWESQEHLEAADKLMEEFSYAAIDASADLAIERGAYATFPGSLWSKGILPIDTAKPAAVALTSHQPDVAKWQALRNKVMATGMRNSNTMAIAPTATISNIVGTTPTIEPIFLREVVKKNLSGSFIVTDPSLRYGRPELCKEAFEVDAMWLLKAAGVRQKWPDQAQSTNIFVKANVKGKDLDVIYTTAWQLGLKTTYYLRGQSASAKTAEVGPKVEIQAPVEEEPVNNLCSLDNPNCESCQ
ncbi:ribonucleoside-diphosphate reductase subunit alpha [Duganella sp. FT27W]|uniref:ribonucleoside-diphosphate reductase subunit alpha n=1 Tax=Duganella sp. FT27W TaxID=2654636 RepID=UPI00128C8A93|nr:ribonucleoside-diphosphate reductase subunit alpha [Duganella sp. FT27W]MPQ56357.1 ribonucleoside-diphosphate reductase subunit alpha [Duganella sp. FT27W]